MGCALLSPQSWEGLKETILTAWPMWVCGTYGCGHTHSWKKLKIRDVGGQGSCQPTEETAVWTRPALQKLVRKRVGESNKYVILKKVSLFRGEIQEWICPCSMRHEVKIPHCTAQLSTDPKWGCPKITKSTLFSTIASPSSQSHCFISFCPPPTQCVCPGGVMF